MSWAGMLLAVVAVAIVAGILTRAVRLAWSKYRGPLLVECPENHEAATVAVKMGQAALSAGFGPVRLELKRCSRWPEKEDCGQQCLAQIESRPADCMVRTVLTRWYEGKRCAVCGKALDQVEWLERKPGLMSAGGVTVQWSDLSPDELPAALATHEAVCWDCHVAERFRRQHPELVIDNRWQPPA